MAEYTPKQARAMQTRTEILHAAQACFARSGFDTTGVAEICEAAGISKGAFYHHFPSKQAVYLELIREWLDEFDQGLTSLRAQEEDVPATLRAMSTSFPAIFQAAQGQLPILLDFWVKSFHDPDIREVTVSPFEYYYDMIAGLIREGIEEGSLAETNPRQTALILVSLGVGALLQGLLAEDSAEWGLVGQEGIDLILQSIERNVHK